MQPQPVRIVLHAYSEEYICKYLPTGWRDQSASWIFDYKIFGLNLKYSTDKLRFIKEDADFIRRQIDAHGISAEIDFTVQHRQNDWTYADSFSGQVNLSAGYVNDRDFVEVDVYEGGLKRAYSKNQKTNYELRLDDADTVDIEVPEGMRLFENVNYQKNVGDNSVYGLNVQKIEYGIYRTRLEFDINENTSYLKTGWVAFKSQTNSAEFLETKIIDTEDKIYMDILIKYNLLLSLINISYPVIIYIEEVKSNGEKKRHQIGQVTANDSNAILHLEMSETFPVELNKSTTSKYTLYAEYHALYPDNEWSLFSFAEGSNSIYINFYGNINSGAFSFKAFSAEKLTDKLVKKIHSTASCQMPFLQQSLPPSAQLFLTSGDGIRGILDALIKTNFQEFQNNLACLFDVGTQVSNVENAYKIVDKSAIFNPDKLLLDLGTVKNMQLKHVPDEWLANNINVGYEKQEYDYPLGRQDFACTLEYINGLNIPSKKMELVSKYRADYTGVHLLHYDYVNSDKKDSKSDNDIFWILAFHIDGKWQAIKGAPVMVSGLEGGGYFNILLSPHWNLRRHKNYIKSILDKHDKLLTRTSSTETQTNMQSIYSGESITEKTNENVSSGTVLFKPIIFEFEALIKKNLAEFLGENPDGYVTFNFNGIECKGFPIEIAGSITDSSQKVTCLAHPDTPNDIQQRLFSKGEKRPLPILPNDNIISIVATVLGGVLADGYDTKLQLSAQLPVGSNIVVSVKSESSWGGGDTWEDDILGSVITLTISSGQTLSNSEEIPNPAGYTNRRFTIISITPNKDSEFNYVVGSQVLI
jgi:hypothetical protein